MMERQPEGVATGKADGKHQGRKTAPSPAQVSELQHRRTARESVTTLASECGESRKTICLVIVPIPPFLPSTCSRQSALDKQ